MKLSDRTLDQLEAEIRLGAAGVKLHTGGKRTALFLGDRFIALLRANEVDDLVERLNASTRWTMLCKAVSRAHFWALPSS